MCASAVKTKRVKDENHHESHKRWRRLQAFHKRVAFQLYRLPFEVLDIILQKSYIHWILNSPTKQRDEEVIRSLISVDVCFFQRITRKRFKREIWRYLRDCYERGKKKHSAICRNNKDFLLKNIQPNDEFIDSLLSHDCITEQQSQFIKRQHSNRNKNAELLQVVRSFDDHQFTNFVKCLRQTNQTQVASIFKNGGVVIKATVQNSGTATAESMDSQLLNQRMNDLRDRTNQRSHQTDQLTTQLQNADMEIVNSQLNRRTVVIWIWCRSQTALQYIEKMYDSNHLGDVFFKNTQPSTSTMINIDRNQLKKTVVVCSIYINFTRRMNIPQNTRVCGVTKFRDKIYVLCQSAYYSPYAICVFENRNPFDLQKKIIIHEIRDPSDIGSSEKENCLYADDYYGKCIWKITIETDYKYKIIKWITTDYELSDTEYISESTILSVTSDDQLVVVSDTSSILRIYESNRKLIRSIRLPADIKKPRQAVETSIGNFVILHQWTEYADDKRSGAKTVKKRWGICEVTRDGQTVIRRFIPLYKTQQLYNTKYLSIDSDDRVFVADYDNDRVILLDSDLKWNRILLSRSAETEEMKIRWPTRLCYDAEKKHLIVDDDHKNIKLFTLST